MKNFEIGKEIKELISQSNDLINGRVFPIVANEGTQFPFVVYRRNGYRPASNKDYLNEVVNLEVTVLSSKYEESINIANDIASSLLNRETQDIENIEISNLTEDYSEDTFIQRINLDIELK